MKYLLGGDYVRLCTPANTMGPKANAVQPSLVGTERAPMSYANQGALPVA